MSQPALLDVAPVLAPAGETDSWFTPLELWRGWDQEFSFTLDPCAHPEAPVSQAIGHGFTIEEDGLRKPWSTESVFCNPPFSDIEPWAAKAHEEMRAGCALVAMLVPANRTEQRWWQQYVEPYRDRLPRIARPTLATRFLPKRFKFGFPGDPTGRGGSSPTFGCVLLVWRQS